MVRSIDTILLNDRESSCFNIRDNNSFFYLFYNFDKCASSDIFYIVFDKEKKWLSVSIDKPGIFTAIAVYITMVGLVYQIILRQIWKPTGTQMIVNELLHSIIPLLVIVFWYLYEEKSPITYKKILQWLIYPIIYLIYILRRGYFSNFYPYPFVDVGNLGLSKVLINSAGLIVLFIFISALFIKLGKIVSNNEKASC